MNCTQVRDSLADYSVGLLAGRRRLAVEQHLAICAACAAELRALQRTADLLELIPAETPPEGLWTGLSSRLAEQDMARVRPKVAGLWLRPAVAFATMMLVAFGIWRPWSRDLPPTPPGVTSTYVQTHLASAPTDVLGGEISRGLWLAGSAEMDR